MSQSKQVFWVFTANVDERALGDMQHPSPCEKGNTKVECRRREVSPPWGSQGGAGIAGRGGEDGPEGRAACGRSLAPASKKSGLELPSRILQVADLLEILCVFTLKAGVKLCC